MLVTKCFLGKLASEEEEDDSASGASESVLREETVSLVTSLVVRIVVNLRVVNMPMKFRMVVVMHKSLVKLEKTEPSTVGLPENLLASVQ